MQAKKVLCHEEAKWIELCVVALENPQGSRLCSFVFYVLVCLFGILI